MTRTAITAPTGAAIGPYSHAIDAGDFIFLSGQTPINPQTGQLIVGDVAIQTERCFLNLFAVLESAGLSSDDVVKVNVYLTDMQDFQAMNKVYELQFNKPYPARTTVAVAALPLGAKVEIELVAKKPGR